MKKAYRKVLVLLLICTMLAALFIGCGSKEEENSSGQNTNSSEVSKESDQQGKDSGKVSKIVFAETVPSEARTEQLKGFIADFESKNPNIKVEFQSIPVEQAREKLITMAAGKSLPDIFEINNSWLGPLAIQGGLEDLGPYVDKWDQKDHMVDAAIKLGKSFNNTLYWIPYGFYGLAVYYNTQMLEDAGVEPPKTLDDFYNVAKATTKDGKYGYAFRGGVYGSTHALLWMMGHTGSPNLFDENGKCVLDSEEAIEGLKEYASLYLDGLVPPDSTNWSYQETVGSFTSGLTAMLIQSNEVVGICNEKMGEGKFNTTMLPIGPSGMVFDTSGQLGYAMSAGSKDKEAAWTLLSYLLSPEVSIEFDKKNGFAPLSKQAKDDPAFTKGPIKVYYEQLLSDNYEYMNTPAYLPEWSEFIGPFSTAELQKMILKEQSVEQTAKNLADFLNKAQQRWEEANK